MDPNAPNSQPPSPAAQMPINPIQWAWISQRSMTDGKAASIWNLGFIAPDGGEVRVTFHQVGDNIEALQQKHQADQQQQNSQAAAMGMPPSPDPTSFAPPGQPTGDVTEGATFYVTYFSNRHPEFFMKWDTSLSHEDSLITWVTITHGIIDFVRKAKPANIILDDLGNGKLKMVLRSVAMDVVGANPEYQLEQTQKHHYRSFFQIKKAGTMSAFQNDVQGRPQEGETEQPQAGTSMAPTVGQSAPEAPPAAQDATMPTDPTGQAANATVNPQDQQTQPGIDQKIEPFPTANPVAIKQIPLAKKGFTLEIGKNDYSVAVKDKENNAVDRYRAKSPADLLRWINDKGYGSNRMVIVDREMPSKSGVKPVILTPAPATDPNVKPVTGSAPAVQEGYVIDGASVKVTKPLTAKQAALMNTVINAETVRLTAEHVEFVFATDKDMNFKCALVELAYEGSTKG